jgi:outer membrane receptor protein involved in Fe transport
LVPESGGYYTLCSTLETIFEVDFDPTDGVGNDPSLNAAFGGQDVDITDGIATDVTGNRLPGAPKFKISGGVQWAIPIGRFELTPRVDAYWQSGMYTNIFNTQQDLIDGYGYMNAQVRFAPTDGIWYVRLFMQNVTNNDAITGAFDVGQSAGNFQNLFLLEPRRYGAALGIVF